MSNPNAQDIDWGCVVLAYGHLFAKEAKLLGTEVPLAHIKVNGQELAQMILVANWVQLAQAGAISLSITTGKTAVHYHDRRRRQEDQRRTGRGHDARAARADHG